MKTILATTLAALLLMGTVGASYGATGATGSAQVPTSNVSCIDKAEALAEITRMRPDVVIVKESASIVLYDSPSAPTSFMLIYDSHGCVIAQTEIAK